MCFILVSSCHNPNQRETINFNIERLTSRTYNFSDIFTHNKVIILEETENSLLSSIIHLKEFNNEFFISDNRHNTIFRFTDSGKFINIIGKQGKGPGELLNMINFQVNENGLIAMDVNKFVLYGHDGTFLKEFFKPTISFDFTYKDDKYLIYNINNPKWPQIIIKDSLFQNKGAFSPLENNQLVMPMAGRSYLLKDSKNIFLTYPFSDTIYKIIDTTSTPNFIFGFGRRKLINYHTLYGGNFTGDLSMYDYSVKDFLTSNYFVSNLALNNKTNLLLFNRKNSNLTLIDSLTNGPDLINGAQLYFVNNNDICYWGYNRTSKNPSFDLLIKNKELNDNPVLILIKIK